MSDVGANIWSRLQVTAPAALRERIGAGNGARIAVRLGTIRARPDASTQERTILAVLRDLARRARQLGDQAGRYRGEITSLVLD